jgi:hypothetical protein
MIQVIAVRPLEDCLIESMNSEWELDQPLGREIMQRMAKGSRLQFYPDFPRPYFRIESPDGYVLQGVLGNTTFRATFSRQNEPQAHLSLRNLIKEQP